MKRIIFGIGRAIGATGRATVALVGICGVVAALANYTMTQGSGTSFGSLVVSTVHYAQQLLCDPTTPSQCGAVDSSGNVSVKDAALITAVGAPTTAIAGTAPSTQTPVATGSTSKIQTDLNGNLYAAPAKHAQTGALASSLTAGSPASVVTSFEVSADSTLSATAWWIMIFDATSAPVDGAVTPAKCYAVPSGTTSYSAGFHTPVALTTGLTIVASTTGCFTKTASAHAFIGADFQ